MKNKPRFKVGDEVSILVIDTLPDSGTIVQVLTSKKSETKYVVNTRYGLYTFNERDLELENWTESLGSAPVIKEEEE